MDSISGVRFATQIEQAAQRHRLDPTLLAAVAAQETGGPGSNSGANIVGDGGHGHGTCSRSTTAAISPSQRPRRQMDCACRTPTMLPACCPACSRSNGGSVHDALSAYNAGSAHAAGTATTWGDGARLGYADSVLRHYAMLGGDPAALGEQLAAGKGDDLTAATAAVSRRRGRRTARRSRVHATAGCGLLAAGHGAATHSVSLAVPLVHGDDPSRRPGSAGRLGNDRAARPLRQRDELRRDYFNSTGDLRWASTCSTVSPARRPAF